MIALPSEILDAFDQLLSNKSLSETRPIRLYKLVALLWGFLF
jgi:hypothetical protein